MQYDDDEEDEDDEECIYAWSVVRAGCAPEDVGHNMNPHALLPGHSAG